MSQLLDFFKQAFVPGQPVEPIPAGMYHFQSPISDPLNYRLHLRVEKDGSGLLIINASTVLHLNQTATEYAYHLINQTPEDQIIETIRRRYDVKSEQIKEDFTNLKNQIDTLIEVPDLDPVTYLDIERQTPYSEDVSAPYRLDCAITYKLPENNPIDLAPVKRVDRELDTAEWKKILTKAWNAGIPHIIFTGGEPTLRDDLPDLIAFAEELGQVTGVLTNGLRLGDASYLHTLLDAGLDHTLIVLEADSKQSWESLASFTYWSETMKEDLFVAVHLTLTQENQTGFLDLIDKLAEAGISGISLSANSSQLSEQLKKAQEHAYSKDLELIWDIPVPYSSMNPIALELENNEESKLISGAGRGWLYIEPDGDILPSQGINQVLGNFLYQDWESIWNEAKGFWQTKKSSPGN